MTVTPTAASSAEEEAARAQRDDASPTPLPKGQLIPLFIGLMLAMLLSSLNNTVLSSAMPTIVGELDGVEHMSWVVTAFILASTVMMPVYGSLSDLFGRRSMLIIAILLFMGGSVIGGLATDMTWLVASRFVQGLGGGGLMILTQAAIADVVPVRERGRYMGIMGGVFALASVAGPLLGGWLTEGPGWRWAFWLNIPLGLLALIATTLFLRLPKRAPAGRVDALGMALLVVATTSIVLLATWAGSQFEWISWESAGLVAIAVVAGALFALVEARADQPVMPLALFRDRNFLLTTVGGLAIGIAMFGTLGYMPMYLQMVTGAGPTISGLLMIPMMAALLITSIISGRLVSATGRYKLLPIIGTGIIALALFLLSTVAVDTPVWIICADLALLGVGLGLSMQILTIIVQNSFPLRIVGTATAATNYFRQVGATLGSAIVGSVFAARLAEELATFMPGGASGGGTGAFTPAAVTALPEPMRTLVLEAVNTALIPIFLDLVPVVLIAFVALLFVHEKPLSTAVGRDAPPEALASGQLQVVDPALDADAVGASFEEGPSGRGAHRDR